MNCPKWGSKEIYQNVGYDVFIDQRYGVVVEEFQHLCLSCDYIIGEVNGELY